MPQNMPLGWDNFAVSPVFQIPAARSAASIGSPSLAAMDAPSTTILHIGAGASGPRIG
jgi:hypothetical protein